MVQTPCRIKTALLWNGWISPGLFVKKNTDELKLRLVCDFRMVNKRINSSPRGSRIGPILADKYGAVTLEDGEMLGFMYDHRCDLGERPVTSRVLGPAVFYDGVCEIDLDKITTSGFLEIFLFFLLLFISSIQHRVITRQIKIQFYKLDQLLNGIH